MTIEIGGLQNFSKYAEPPPVDTVHVVWYTHAALLIRLLQHHARLPRFNVPLHNINCNRRDKHTFLFLAIRRTIAPCAVWHAIVNARVRFSRR